MSVRLCAVVLALLNGVISASSVQDRPFPTLAEYQRMAPEEKRATLRRVASTEVSQRALPTESLRVLIEVGLQDQNAEIRRDTIGLITSRVMAARAGRIADRDKWASEELPTLQDSRGRLTAILKGGTDDRLRLSALIALGNLEYVPGARPVNMPLSKQFIELLRRVYAEDTSNSLRTEAIKGLALTETRSDVIATTLLRALSDSSVSVIQFAVIGAANHGLTRGLPRVVSLLAHEDRAIRMSAAQALIKFGSSAKQYEPQLQVAISAERDERTLKTMQGALARLQQ